MLQGVKCGLVQLVGFSHLLDLEKRSVHAAKVLDELLIFYTRPGAFGEG